MTIFHVIKFSPLPNVTKQAQLDLLPKEVIAKWRRRVEDYAIECAKSVMHLDTTGRAQKAIDAIYLYRAGKIGIDELSGVANAAAGYAAAAAAGYAAAAAAAAYAAGYAAAAAAGYAAAARNTKRQDTLGLFAEWLTEELMNYELDEVMV